MRENMKKRIAVFLSILFVLPAVMSILPMASEEVQAADYTYVGWNISSYNYSGANRSISVEAGQKFNIGNYVSVQTSSVSSIASMVKATYKSSKTSVASIDSKGNLKAKKPGKTTITVAYKGKKATAVLTVVKAGSFGNEELIADLQNKVDTLVKDLPSKITVKNGYAVLKKKSAYYNEMTDYSKGYIAKISFDGFLRDNYSTTDKLAVPDAGKYNQVTNLLSSYAGKNNPTSTRSAKGVKVKSVTAKSSGITLKLNKSITDEHILAANIMYSYSNKEAVSRKTAKTYVSIQDKTTHKYYSGEVTLKKGSKTATVVAKEYRFSGGVSKYVKVKLKKGHTYQLGSALDWAKGKTFKIK